MWHENTSSSLSVTCPETYNGSKMHVKNLNIDTEVKVGWGECTCPDGTMEYVSAKENGCGTHGELECTGGVSGQCNPSSNLLGKG
jgi:hypothetical protein